MRVPSTAVRARSGGESRGAPVTGRDGSRHPPKPSCGRSRPNWPHLAPKAAAAGSNPAGAQRIAALTWGSPREALHSASGSSSGAICVSGQGVDPRTTPHHPARAPGLTSPRLGLRLGFWGGVLEGGAWARGTSRATAAPMDHPRWPREGHRRPRGIDPRPLSVLCSGQRTTLRRCGLVPMTPPHLETTLLELAVPDYVVRLDQARRRPLGRHGRRRGRDERERQEGRLAITDRATPTQCASGD